jgi:hypothetical protein
MTRKHRVVFGSRAGVYGEPLHPHSSVLGWIALRRSHLTLKHKGVQVEIDLGETHGQ